MKYGKCNVLTSTVVEKLFLWGTTKRRRQKGKSVTEGISGICPFGKPMISLTSAQYAGGYNSNNPCLPCPYPVVKITETVTIMHIKASEHPVNI